MQSAVSEKHIKVLLQLLGAERRVRLSSDAVEQATTLSDFWRHLFTQRAMISLNGARDKKLSKLLNCSASLSIV